MVFWDTALRSFVGSSELQAIALQTTEIFTLQLLVFVVVVVVGFCRCCWLLFVFVVVGCRCLLLLVVICCRRRCLLLSSSLFDAVFVVVCCCCSTTGFFSVKYHVSNENSAATNAGSTSNLCPSWLSPLATLHPKYLFTSHTNTGIRTCQSTENDYVGLYVLHTRRQTGNKAHVVITAGIKLPIELACLLSSLNTIRLAQRQERAWWFVSVLFWVFRHGAIIQCFRCGLTESLSTYSTVKIRPTSPF